MVVQFIVPIIKATDQWIDNNPKLAKTLVMTASAIGIALAGIVGLAAAFASMFGVIALIGPLISSLGVGLGALPLIFTKNIAAIKSLSGSIALLSPVIKSLGAGLGALVGIISIKVIAVIAALAAAAYLVYRNWEPIAEFLQKFRNRNCKRL